MDIYTLNSAGMRQGLTPAESPGLIWIDAQRTDSDWPIQVREQLGVAVHDRHLSDLQNERHPPFYDGSDDYDLLIVRSADCVSPPESPRTNPVAFLVTPHAVVSVRPPDDPVFDNLRDKLLHGRRAAPMTPAMLLHLLLDQVGNGLLALRQPMSEKLTELQTRLLDQRDPFDDWQLLMDMRTRYRWLDTNLGIQREVIASWREETAVVELDQAMRVRFNDLDDHLARVERHARLLESDINTLVEVHFAARTERSGRVMQFLTVLSAVFLPLNLVAGFFGMNFRDMPLLANPWGFWGVLAAMVLLAVTLLVWFRLRRWI